MSVKCPFQVMPMRTIHSASASTADSVTPFEDIEKKESIRIWLNQLKVSRIQVVLFTILMPAQSSPKSRSSTSVSSVKRGITGVKRGVKRTKKPANARPLKHAKRAAPVDESNPKIVDDDDSIMTNGTEPEVIDVDSDIDSEDKDMDVLKEELGTYSTFLFFLVFFLIYFSSSTENLEIPGVFILQARRNYSDRQGPCRSLLFVLCGKMQE